MPIHLCASEISDFRSQILRSWEKRTIDQLIHEIDAIRSPNFNETVDYRAITEEVGAKMESGTVIAILPCNDLDASERFYSRLGFMSIEGRPPEEVETYRMLSNGKGRLHLTAAVGGWLVPGRNPFGLYFYLEDVDIWAAEFRDEILGKNAPEDKPWGTYEFAVSDPDETLVRVGWPSRLRKILPDLGV